MMKTIHDIDVPCFECGGFLDDHLPECPEDEAEQEFRAMRERERERGSWGNFRA
jgi:hypothetical protein